MTLTIELKPETQARLQQAATLSGMPVPEFTQRFLDEQLPATNANLPTSAPAEDSHFLLKINEGLPENTWLRYRELVGKRQAETLTEIEHQELMILTRQVEADSATRIVNLAALAKVRNVSLDVVKTQLGISTTSYE